MVKKIEISQHGKYNCYFCGKVGQRDKSGEFLLKCTIPVEHHEAEVCGDMELQQV